MLHSAITVSLVEEARGGPFLFWDGVENACDEARLLGFDAIELFPPSAEAIDVGALREQLQQHDLSLAAVGTGAGMVRHQLSLTGPDPKQRRRAEAFVKSIIDLGGPFGAPAIIGSMQGRWGGEVSRETALAYLADALQELGTYAAQYDVPLLYEPLNRYETNLVNTVAQGVVLLEGMRTENVRLLADLFHMNIEEADLATAIRAGGRHIGHVHFVDSNRQPAGRGHLDFGPVAAALKEIGYQGYASAEALPIPDSKEAARLTMKAFQKHFR